MERQGGLEPSLKRAWIDSKIPCVRRIRSRLLSKPGFKPCCLLYISSQWATCSHAMALGVHGLAPYGVCTNVERQGGLEPSLKRAWIDSKIPCVRRIRSRLLSKPGFKPCCLLYISSQWATCSHAMALGVHGLAPYGVCTFLSIFEAIGYL